MKYNKWIKKELDLLTEKSPKVGDKELTELLPRHSKGSIKAKRRKMGIVKDGKPGLRKLPPDFTIDVLDNIGKQVFIGSLLGDGYIIKRKQLRHCSFGETHGKKQEDYLRWKYNLLKPFMPSITKDGRSLSTPSHPFFTQLRTQMYSGSKKVKLPTELMLQIDRLGLLIWYLDDGGLSRRQPDIYNTCFYRDVLRPAICYINQKFMLSLDVRENRISLKKANRDILFPVWEKMFQELQIPKSIYYKLR